MTAKNISLAKGSLIALAVMGASMARASFTLYTDQAQFLGQLGSYYLDTYSDLPDGISITSPTNRTDGIFSYLVTGADFSLSGSGYSDIAISTGNFDADIDFNSFLGPVNAVGGDFFLTEIDMAKTNGTMTVSLNGGVFSTNIVSDISLSNQFLGWVATDGDVITSITVSTASLQYNTVDNFIVGQSIPEPSVMVLSALFGTGILAVRRFFRI